MKVPVTMTQLQLWMMHHVFILRLIISMPMGMVLEQRILFIMGVICPWGLLLSQEIVMTATRRLQALPVIQMTGDKVSGMPMFIKVYILTTTKVILFVKEIHTILN